MLNNLKKLICTCLFVAGMIPIYTVNTNASAIDECMFIANEIKQEIERDEKTELTVMDCHTLYDVELNPNYLLIEFSNGYAIVGKNNHIISEYDIVSHDNPYQGFEETNLWVYGGPFNYLQIEKSALNSRSVNPLNVSEELIELLKLIIPGLVLVLVDLLDMILENGLTVQVTILHQLVIQIKVFVGLFLQRL